MFKLLRDSPSKNFFSYESFHARKKKNQVPTSYLQDSPLSFFCPTSCSIRESEGFFRRRATYKGKYGKAKEAIESARAGLSPQEGDMRKSRKRKEEKKTREGEKVAPAKARFRVPYTKNSFFGSRVFGLRSGLS